MVSSKWGRKRFWCSCSKCGGGGSRGTRLRRFQSAAHPPSPPPLRRSASSTATRTQVRTSAVHLNPGERRRRVSDDASATRVRPPLARPPPTHRQPTQGHVRPPRRQTVPARLWPRRRGAPARPRLDGVGHDPPCQPRLAVAHRRLCCPRLFAPRLRPGRHHPRHGPRAESVPVGRRRQGEPGSRDRVGGERPVFPFQLTPLTPIIPPGFQFSSAIARFAAHDARDSVCRTALHVPARPVGRYPGRHRPAGRPQLPDGGPGLPFCRAQSPAQLDGRQGGHPAARHRV